MIAGTVVLPPRPTMALVVSVCSGGGEGAGGEKCVALNFPSVCTLLGWMDGWMELVMVARGPVLVWGGRGACEGQRLVRYVGKGGQLFAVLCHAFPPTLTANLRYPAAGTLLHACHPLPPPCIT